VVNKKGTRDVLQRDQMVCCILACNILAYIVLTKKGLQEPLASATFALPLQGLVVHTNLGMD